MNWIKFVLSYFIGKSHVEEDGAQNYIVFQSIHRYIKITNGKYISWKSNGLSDETLTPYATSDNSLTPLIDHYGSKVRVKGRRYGKGHNVYISYDLSASGSNDNDPTLKNCLFGAVTLIKNTNINQYEYSGYGIGLDRRSSFSFPRGGINQNVLIFGVGMRSSVHIDNKKKYILVLGKGLTQGLEHILTAEKMYSVLLLQIKYFVWVWITMEEIVICVLMVQKFTNLKQKILKF